MNYVPSQLQARFKELGFIWPSGCHLIGVRSKADKPNSFDDTFYLIFGKACWKFTGTTNPGGYYLLNWLNKLGAAVMKDDEQYIDAYTLGLHRGVYEALVQAKPVKVYRDNDKDDKSEQIGKWYSGFFGINIHRASAKWISKLVDRFSAGCQVLNNPEHFKTLISICKSSRQKFFTYTLLREW